MTPAPVENPAQLSVELAGLFPPGVVAAELRQTAPAGLLTPAELQSISHCAGKRIRDFAAGRACAHRALREVGIENFSLLAGHKRQPLWPASIVGSITHTDGYCAAVVARERDLRALGVDCEVIDAVDEELWPGICTPPELDRLQQLPPDARCSHAALIFAAKEAFYKCQFPLTAAWVGFEDVVIEPGIWPAASGSFTVVPRKPLGLDFRLVAALSGRFYYCDRWVIAGMAAPITPDSLP